VGAPDIVEPSIMSPAETAARVMAEPIAVMPVPIMLF
jgi:hypothetical protein